MAALIGGAPAKPGQFPGAVYLGTRCTAVKVAPRHLLTAAHCVLDRATAEVKLPPGTSLAITRDPAEGYVHVPVAAVHVHPAWLDACERTYCAISSVAGTLDAPDVAVIELSEDLRDVSSARVDTTPLEPGDPVVVLGFGCTEGVAVRDARAQPSLAWARAEIVPASRAIHPGSFVGESDRPVFDSLYAITAGPGLLAARAGLCPGDSGGPLYKSVDGELVVVGINANYTLMPEGDDTVGLPVTNWHTRLDAGSRHDVAGFLASIVGGAQPR
jgi:secreted trypsin-like serine protease